MVQAVVLAAGYGTRLKPLTDKVPKGMLLVNNKPILEHIIDNLRNNGVKDIILCVGYKKEQIIKYFGNGKKLGVNIQYSKEPRPFNTFTTLRKAEKLIVEKNFLLINGDTIYTGPYNYLIYDHIKLRAIITLMVHHRSLGSVIDTDGNYKVTRYIEKPVFNVNSGICMMNKDIFDIKCKELSDLNSMCDVYISPCLGQRIAIDSIQRLKEANVLFK